MAKKIKVGENDYSSVVIEDNVWIGANCTILSGTYLKRGTVVAAGSVVSIKTPENAIVVGNPAKVVGYRGMFPEGKSKYYEYYDC